MVVKRAGQEAGTAAGQDAPVMLHGRELTPNRKIDLNMDWVEEIQVNTSAVERRAATIGTRRTVKKEWQAAWLLRAIACMDLTTLSGDDTAERVKRLCAKARRPLEDHLVKALGIEELEIGGRRGLTVGAVCVYHAFVETAVKALEGSGIPVAAVSTGFPAGLSPLETRVEEIRRSVADSGDRGSAYIAQCCQGELGGDDGGGGRYQDQHGERGCECDAAGEPGDGAGDSGVCGADGDVGGV
jgi:deoxyribose-phosphate aldolase